MKTVAQFEGHEVSADGVMVELLRSFGEDGIQLLSVFDDEQLRDLLGRLGTAPATVKDHNRLELLYLLSTKVRGSDDALIVAAFITQAFGMSDDDDCIMPLSEGFIEYTTSDGFEEEDEEDDEDDQTVCDSCGGEFDSVGRCSCATSYDFDQDHSGDDTVIKPKDSSEVLNVNYANSVNELRDEVVLAIIPHIYSAEGADIHLHTAEQVRLWLQQAYHRDLLDVLHHIQNPDNSLKGPDVIQQDSKLFSDRHMVLLQILSELFPQDENDIRTEQPQDTAVEQARLKYEEFVRELLTRHALNVMSPIDDYTDDVLMLQTAEDVRQWLIAASVEELQGVWDLQVENEDASDYQELAHAAGGKREELLRNILSACCNNNFFDDVDDADDENYALKS